MNTKWLSLPAGAWKCSGAFFQHPALSHHPLTDGLNNSLAAALEISAWIQSRDMKVKIIHGSVPDMVNQVLLHHQAFAAKRSLKKKRIGVIGTPASWLVASHVDYLLAGQRWGVTYTDISIETVEKAFHEITEDEIGPEASLFAQRAKGIQEATPEELLRAMRLYKAIRRVCQEENLDALTLSCFSLIQSLKTTGCLALSLLNDEGIPAGCEGDLQSIMTLLMVKELIGKPGFMANPSFVDLARNEVLLAHCSIPTKNGRRVLLSATILRQKAVSPFRALYIRAKSPFSNAEESVWTNIICPRDTSSKIPTW